MRMTLMVGTCRARRGRGDAEKPSTAITLVGGELDVGGQLSWRDPMREATRRIESQASKRSERMTTKTSEWNKLEVGGMGLYSLSCTDRQARWQGAVLLVALVNAQSTSEWVPGGQAGVRGVVQTDMGSRHGRVTRPAMGTVFLTSSRNRDVAVAPLDHLA